MIFNVEYDDEYILKFPPFFEVTQTNEIQYSIQHSVQICINEWLIVINVTP